MFTTLSSAVEKRNVPRLSFNPSLLLCGSHGSGENLSSAGGRSESLSLHAPNAELIADLLDDDSDDSPREGWSDKADRRAGGRGKKEEDEAFAAQVAKEGSDTTGGSDDAAAGAAADGAAAAGAPRESVGSGQASKQQRDALSSATESSMSAAKMDVEAFMQAAEIDDVLVQAILLRNRLAVSSLFKKQEAGSQTDLLERELSAALDAGGGLQSHPSTPQRSSFPMVSAVGATLSAVFGFSSTPLVAEGEEPPHG